MITKSHKLLKTSIGGEAVAGTTMSYKLTKATFYYLNSDDDYEPGFVIDLVSKINPIS